jgi:hypothetical protein
MMRQTDYTNLRLCAAAAVYQCQHELHIYDRYYAAVNVNIILSCTAQLRILQNYKHYHN